MTNVSRPSAGRTCLPPGAAVPVPPSSLRVLWIATKPPWPPLDGGRLVMAATLDGLAAAGVEITLVAPAPDGIGPAHSFVRASRPPASACAPFERPRGADSPRIRTILVRAAARSWLAAASHGVRAGQPIAVARHASGAVARQVEALIRAEPFDLVHIEQPHALANAIAARRAGLACVLRAQNVEHELWTAEAGRRSAARPLFRLEAARMRRFEASALAAADLTIALSPLDAARLAALDPAAHVRAIPPPVPLDWPAAADALSGEPAFTWIGSRGWRLNADALAWLHESIWPAIAARLPAARLHVFGGTTASSRIHHHAAPADSGAAFAPGSILLLPLRAAAGVRMRLLEAWARGVPVIASPAAVAGLDTADGRDVLIARDAHAFADAAARLAQDAHLRRTLIAGGRATLARRHDPAVIAAATIDAYREAIDIRAARAR